MRDDLHRASRIPAAVESQWRRQGMRSDEAIGNLLEDAARRWPDRPAVITEKETTTFAQLGHHSSQLAHALLDAGVSHGDVVCWMLPTGPDAVALAAAIWRIGAVSSPIVPVYGTREIAAALDQVSPAAVVTTADTSRRDHVADFEAAFLATGQAPTRLLVSGDRPEWAQIGDSKKPVPALPEDLAGSMDDPCLILFTSGTESGPKGVIHSVAGLMHEVRSTVEAWGITFRDVMVMASPMTHITGLLQGFLIPARVGGAAILLERWVPSTCVNLIEEHSATYMAGATPFLRELLAAYTEAGLTSSSLQQYCCGGASVPPELIRRADDLGISAYRAWGMTELPTGTLPSELDPLAARAETDGRLAPGIEVLITRSDGSPAGPGESGELFVRGPELMVGYVRRELDDAAFTPGGWFVTGDLAMLDDDGRLTITGRVKDIINRGGEKLSAKEIEDVLLGHPDISAAAVVAVPGGRLGERVGAAIVSTQRLSIAEVGTFVTGAGLARQKQPEIIVTVEQLPSNATGKIDKRSLRELFTIDGRDAPE